MRFSKFLAIAALVAVPGLAAAQSPEDCYVSQLRNQGFDEITVSRTLLGRVRIEAISDRYERELVFHPRTGVILRDQWQEIGEAQGEFLLIDPDDDDDFEGPEDPNQDPEDNGDGAGEDGGDDGGDDEDDDDDDEDDDDDGDDDDD